MFIRKRSSGRTFPSSVEPRLGKRLARLTLLESAMVVSFLMAATACVACADMTRAGADHPQSMSAGMVEFVQITITRLDAGDRTFEGFRIHRQGMFEWAMWDGSGRLLGHSEPRDMGSELFPRILSTPTLSNPPEPLQDDGTAGRWSLRLDIAVLTESGITSVVLTRMPDDIAALTNTLRRGVVEEVVPPGWYVWSKPYARVGKADIDLAAAGSDSPVAQEMARALGTGRLIARADDSVQTFHTGELANRLEFTARLRSGDLRFGVLRVR